MRSCFCPKFENEIKNLEKEKTDLETESYVKSRTLADSFGKEPELLKEYGQRLKWIPKRLREIEMQINQLMDERNRISK